MAYPQNDYDLMRAGVPIEVRARIGLEECRRLAELRRRMKAGENVFGDMLPEVLDYSAEFQRECDELREMEERDS